MDSGGAGTVAVCGALVLAANGIGGRAGAGAGGSAADVVSSARVTRSKQAARKGRADDAWRGLNLRRVKKIAEPALNCAINSYGRVRDFFLRNPCKSLDRTLVTLADPDGTGMSGERPPDPRRTRWETRRFTQGPDFFSIVVDVAAELPG